MAVLETNATAITFQSNLHRVATASAPRRSGGPVAPRRGREGAAAGARPHAARAAVGIQPRTAATGQRARIASPTIAPAIGRGRATLSAG